jgi:hypothetical protein
MSIHLQPTERLTEAFYALGEYSSDEEKSIDGDNFEWKQNDYPNVNTDFLNWAEDPNFDPQRKWELNCSQGLFYYISQKDDRLRERLKAHMERLESSGRTKEEACGYRLLGPYLGLTAHGGLTGPFPIEDLEDKLRVSRPGTIVSFGAPTANMHVVIVAQNKKIRSLWTNNPDNQGSFGKFSIRKIATVMKETFADFTDEELAEHNLSRVFYTTENCCDLFIEKPKTDKSSDETMLESDDSEEIV